MMATTTNGTQTIQGHVEHANEQGLKLAGETSWRNISKFAADCPDPQDYAGQDVVLTLDKQGYIRQIAPVAQEAPEEATPPTATPAPSQAPVPAAAPAPPDKDTLIARQVALKAAAEILGGDITTTADLDRTIELAACFEQWLLRPAA